MKNFITVLVLFTSISAFASDTVCWTDSHGITRCTSSDDITPKGAY